MVALAAFMKYNGEQPLGGVIGLEAQLALENIPQMSEQDLEVKRKTPLFLTHGQRDQVLPYGNSQKTYEYFKNAIYSGDSGSNLTIAYEPGFESNMFSENLEK